MRLLARTACVLLFVALSPEQRVKAGGSCGELSALALPNVVITQAQAIEAGSFTSSGLVNAAAARALPAFCRVAATLKPTSDSNINMEVWLPTTGWNGKFQAVGNGAFSGAIAYAAMMSALARGYATASTKGTGSTNDATNFACRAR